MKDKDFIITSKQLTELVFKITSPQTSACILHSGRPSSTLRYLIPCILSLCGHLLYLHLILHSYPVLPSYPLGSQPVTHLKWNMLATHIKHVSLGWLHRPPALFNLDS